MNWNYNRKKERHKSMSEKRLLSALSESESVESKISFDDERLKKVREDLMS